MSTNASISIIKKDGTVDMAYCHHDGYLIEGVGEVLLNHYKDAESIKELIRGGAMRGLGETIQSTDFYGVGDNCHSFNNIFEYHEARKQKYDYLFDEKAGSWSFSKEYSGSYKPLTQEAINNDREKVVYNFIKERDNHPNDVQWRKGVIENHIIKGADFENVKKMIKPHDLSKQVSPFAQDKFDYAQTVADKVKLNHKIQDNLDKKPILMTKQLSNDIQSSTYDYGTKATKSANTKI